jgi:hypothetical protein
LWLFFDLRVSIFGSMLAEREELALLSHAQQTLAYNFTRVLSGKDIV